MVLLANLGNKNDNDSHNIKKMTVHVNLMKGKCVVFINASTLVAGYTGCEPYG